jgi:dolichyl-diphosphooligosaccharide--protein glycosyltransferase
VVTDIEMAVSKFWAMATWYNTTAQTAPYQMTMYTRDQENSNVLNPVTVNIQPYYETTVARLHLFDGSETAPGTAYYIEYQDPSKAGTALPLITTVRSVNATEAVAQAAAYNARAAAGTHAIAAGVQPNQPIETVEALGHYRLVHESPTGTSQTIKYVKVFEYVKGARLDGEGTIEVPVVTNTGRSFTWQATAVDGEFVLPYATGGSTGDVHTTGPYRLLSTGRTVEVSEAAVQAGSAL